MEEHSKWQSICSAKRVMITPLEILLLAQTVVWQTQSWLQPCVLRRNRMSVWFSYVSISTKVFIFFCLFMWKICSGEATLYSEHGFSENSLEHDGSESSELPYMMPMGPRLTKSQEKKVLEKLGTIRSELPIYVAVMKKTNLTGQSFASSLVSSEKFLLIFNWQLCSLEKSD